MDAFQVWKRLLWKEYREGRLVVLLAAAAPFVLFSLPTHHPPSAMFVVPGAVGVHLAIAFWGAGRGGGKRTGSEFAWTHLPTNPAVEWLASMVVPTIVIAAVGAWYGLMAEQDASGSASGFGYGMSFPLAGMLDLATTFTICYLISMVISNWAAYIFGVFRLVGGTLISVWDLNLIDTPDAVWTVMRTLAAAILGAFIYVVLLRKRSTAMRQGVSLAVVVLITFAPLIPEIPIRQAVSGWISGRQASDILSSYTLQSDDGSVNIHATKPYMQGKAYLVMRDYRLGITRKRRFPVCWVFKVQPDGRAYMAHAENSGVQIIEWNGIKDQVRTVVTMPVRGRFFGGIGWQCSVSPDGRYMALILKSMLHDDAADLWVLDLCNKSSKLVLPSVTTPGAGDSDSAHPKLAWPKGEVAVWTYSSGALAVNLKTLATRRIALDEEEDKR